MNYENININLINAISDNLPPKTNLAFYLIEILSISKEAAYRRLRGDVPFTFEEAAKITSNLKISLDKTIGNNSNMGAIVNLDIIRSPDYILNYNVTLEKYIKVCDIIEHDPTSSLNEATNKLPLHLYAQYTYITKFWVSRWLHQSNNLKGTGSLDDILIPEKTIALHKLLAKKLRSIPLSIFVWDKNTFLKFIKGVSYFAKLNLLSRNDVDHIKRELFEILDDLEIIMANAKYPEGGKVFIYICNIPIETIYSYIESQNINISMLRIYAINLIDSQHPDIFQLQKDWIQSLRRYSTLIADSSEMERVKYFEQQRIYIDSL